MTKLEKALPRRLLAPLLIALVSITHVFDSAADTLSSQQLEEIKQATAAVAAKDALPGLSVAVALGDQVWSANVGSADLEHQVPVDARTMFRTASISKWLTATAAMRLAEAGKLDLEAPIQHYCPQYPQKDAPITARQLLSHLSGIRHYHGANGEAPKTDAERKALGELIQRERSTQFTRYTDVIAPLDGFKNDALKLAPGTGFLYTSLGYRVLACVLEGAAQSPYRTLMRELVFAPAGMRTITEDDALEIVPHRAAGYSRNSDRALIRAPFRDVSENLPAGGHLATTEELARFAVAFNSGKLVQPATRDRMLARPKLSDGREVPFAPPFFGLGTQAYYGAGVFVGEANGEQVVAHSGSQAGTSTELVLAPKRNVAVAVMANVDGWLGAHALATKILEIVKR